MHQLASTLHTINAYYFELKKEYFWGSTYQFYASVDFEYEFNSYVVEIFIDNIDMNRIGCLKGTLWMYLLQSKINGPGFHFIQTALLVWF